jgi:hypothetical protein
MRVTLTRAQFIIFAQQKAPCRVDKLADDDREGRLHPIMIACQPQAAISVPMA